MMGGQNPSADVTVCSQSEPDASLSDHGTDNRKRKDFLRKRNALYARRKYARRKIETDVLQEQCLQLEESNHHLKLEETRLRSLLASARNAVERYNSTQQGQHMFGSLYPPVIPIHSASLPLPFASNAESILMQELARQQAYTALTQGGGLPVLTNNTHPSVTGASPGVAQQDTMRFHQLYSGATRDYPAEAPLAGMVSGYPGGAYAPTQMLNQLLLQQQLTQQNRLHAQIFNANAVKGAENHVYAERGQRKDMGNYR